MKLIRTLFFIPVAFIANALTYTLVQIVFSFRTIIKEWNLDSIMRNPTIFEDVLGQCIATAVFFSAGLAIAPNKTKNYCIALIIGFVIALILNIFSILSMNQNYRLLGALASVFVAFYSFKDNDEFEE